MKIARTIAWLIMCFGFIEGMGHLIPPFIPFLIIWIILVTLVVWLVGTSIENDKMV